MSETEPRDQLTRSDKRVGNCYCPFLPPEFRTNYKTPEPHHSFDITKHLSSPLPKHLFISNGLSVQVPEFLTMPFAFCSWIKYHQSMDVQGCRGARLGRRTPQPHSQFLENKACMHIVLKEYS